MGGFDLGFALAGLDVVAQVEIEPYCLSILEHYFPNAKRYGDIREVTGGQITRDCGAIELICGGFPCQDISSAGKGAGLDAARSGLWWEMHRLIGELRPRWVVIENVATLRVRGLDRVKAALEAMGYKVHCWGIRAASVGASNERKRIWILAYLPGQRLGPQGTKSKRQQRSSGAAGGGSSLADTDSIIRTASALEGWGPVVATAEVSEESRGVSNVAHTDCDRIWEQPGRSQWADWSYSPFHFPAGQGRQQYDWEEPRTVESKMGVTTDGIPRKLALRAIGNSIVPAIAFGIARTIERVERALASKSF